MHCKHFQILWFQTRWCQVVDCKPSSDKTIYRLLYLKHINEFLFQHIFHFSSTKTTTWNNYIIFVLMLVHVFIKAAFDVSIIIIFHLIMISNKMVDQNLFNKEKQKLTLNLIGFIIWRAILNSCVYLTFLCQHQKCNIFNSNSNLKILY